LGNTEIRERALAAAIVAAALAIRLAWLAAPHDLQPDGNEYVRLAHWLATAHIYMPRSHTS
jgi:hypothetical protein